MEKINKVFRNGEPLSAEELNGIVRYINELGETIEENLDDWSSQNAVEEMWNSLKEDDDSNRIHNSHSPLSYPLSSINGANLGLPPYSDMAITSDGNGGWLWKKVNQGGGGGSGSSSLQGINKQRTYFLNVAHGIVPSAPSVNNYNSSPQDNFTNGQDVWTFTNTNPTNDLDTYAIWVWFLSNIPVNIDGPIKIYDGVINSSNGEDGEEIEWIYRRVSVLPSETTLNSWENTLANCIGSASALNEKTFENADAVPFDWYDNPQGVTYTEKYEYASFRRSVNGSNGKRVWGTTGFCRPFIWSTYGEKGMDGDGIEYIFWGKAEAVTDWNTFSLNSQNLVNYPPSWTNNEGFQDNEYFGPYGSSWTDDPLGINSTTRRYIYMSKRKKVRDPLTGVSSWEPFSIPALWLLFIDEPDNGINGSYVLEVYRNDTAALRANLSNVPSQDNREYPPTGWSTTPQERSSNLYTWCMQRTMGFNEYNNPIAGPWGEPFRLTGDNGEPGEDGKYTEFIYKHFTSELTFGNNANNPSTWSTTDNNLNSPNNPQREDYTGPSGNKWSDNPQGVDDINTHEYVCQRTFDGNNYSAFTNPILWSKYGENGRDGDGFEYIFKGFSSEQTSWTQNIDYPPSWTSLLDFLNNDYRGPNGHLWSDDAIGVDSTNNKFVYVCSRKKYIDGNGTIATWHAFSQPKLWALYVLPGGAGPAGRNGSYTQFIFKTTSLDLSNSANYSELNTSNSSIPSGWSLSATSASNSSEYVWSTHRLISYNSSNEEVYGAWQTPYKVSGPQGQQGPPGQGSGTTVVTTVYLLVTDISEIRFKQNHAGITSWIPTLFDLQLYKFEGTTFLKLNSLPSGFNIYKSVGTTNTQMSLIGTILTANLGLVLNDIFVNKVGFLLTNGENLVCACYLSVIKEYLRMLIPMGAYIDKEYVMTNTTVPLVLGSNGVYYYLDADTNRINNVNIDPTTTNQTVWGEASEYEVILTKALFADFAKLGSFVVYDKYFFSLFGYLYDSDGSYSIINTSSAAPAAYANFDPNDPMVNTLPSSGHLKFRPAKIINAETGEEWGANGNIHIGTDGSVDIKGNILATSLIAGSTSGLNITTTGTAINFNEGNDTRAYFTSESSGLLLYIKNPSDGVWYKIDFSKWYNTQQLNVTFISHTFFTVNSSTNSINVSDVISLTTLYWYNNEWYTTASTTGYYPSTSTKYYRRVPVSEFEDTSNKNASRPCLYHRGTYERYYLNSGDLDTEICHFAMNYVYAFIETQYNSSTHKMVDTGYVFYVAYGGYSASGPTGGPNTGYRESRTNYYVLSTNVSRSSSPIFLTFDSNHNNESCSYILNANNSLKEDHVYPYWTVSTPMKLIQYTSLLGGQSTINAIRTNSAPTLLEDDDEGYNSSYNFMENIDSDFSSNVSELN